MSDSVRLESFCSRIDGPIDTMSRLSQSLLFAELSSASYYDYEHALAIVQQMGFSEVQFFDRDGAQAYLYTSDADCVIACRGTEPHEWNDIKADVDAVSVLTETFGRVHRGFKLEVDDLWPMLEEALGKNTKSVWFTGHSLGGAMATICAGRCFLSEIASVPSALYTYGSPRVGDRRFINFVELDHTRWVNNNDIVTRVPPAWLGYRHGGREWYLNRNGRIRNVNGWMRSLDRLRGFLSGLTRFQVDHFADHSIECYIQHIRKAVESESL